MSEVHSGAGLENKGTIYCNVFLVLGTNKSEI